MEKAIDPICGMSVDPATAAGHSSYESRDYYFCSVACKREFDENPAKYAGTGTPSRNAADDPRWTKTGEVVSPKFGAAGNGGAEYEPLPGDPRRKE